MSMTWDQDSVKIVIPDGEIQTEYYAIKKMINECFRHFANKDVNRFQMEVPATFETLKKGKLIEVKSLYKCNVSRSNYNVFLRKKRYSKALWDTFNEVFVEVCAFNPKIPSKWDVAKRMVK